eukprot:TRINITY_DN502_c0_g1_i1.p1 TRINITY_DN502_c0_g1~~TRINITY_DN502_c0_g1_i1.p1  ORF type:complete len:673 (-),score=161.00 TRINITY_DN502_c0_g1_i1:147-2165(-)
MSHSVDQHCINTIRVLAADVVEKAKSGHPGAPMGCAPMAHLLWSRFMKYSPANPKWFGRDRFVLSNGHACALQYVMLHLSGYDVTMDDLKSFRQLDSKTPGHPENFITPGIEVSTGPLGQGLSNAVGLAMAERFFAAKFNTAECPDLVDNYTYVICGDGCLQEGITSEASSLAGHLALGKLIVLYDDNHITIDGPTDITFTENVLARYESYGWHTLVVEDGNNDFESIGKAVEEAKKVTNKPSLIKIRTYIGFGSTKQNSEKVHGAPLGKDEIVNVKKHFGFPEDVSFHVPEEVSNHYKELKITGASLESEWNAKFAKYAEANPQKAAELTRLIKGELPEGWENALPRYSPSDAAKATRQLSEICINKLAQVLPEFLGGSADLAGSNLTDIKGDKDFCKEHYDGRIIRFGVREHAMAAICNGLQAYGGLIPFCATFLNFVGYCAGAVRLSALSHHQVIYVMTHDSIGLGEDGPTHQPIETVPYLRSMPRMYTFRPADGNEVTASYIKAISSRDRPSTLCLTRQPLPNLVGSTVEKALKGAYVLHEGSEKPDATLISTGSEVSLCEEVAKALPNLKIRIISAPCLELFEEQTKEYQESLFVPGSPVISVEAASTFGWHKYAHAPIGIDRFGASAPIKDVYKKLGLTADVIAAKVQAAVNFYNGNAPNLAAHPF